MKLKFNYDSTETSLALKDLRSLPLLVLEINIVGDPAQIFSLQRAFSKNALRCGYSAHFNNELSQV